MRSLDRFGESVRVERSHVPLPSVFDFVKLPNIFALMKRICFLLLSLDADLQLNRLQKEKKTCENRSPCDWCVTRLKI